MDIHNLQKYTNRPEVYENGTHVMWTDEYISKQLLQAHINPHSDIASRSREKIALITTWIHGMLSQEKLDILDLGCGPGLYAEQFAELGHTVVGIDFSKNSIDYAKEQAAKKNYPNEYICQNYLNVSYDNQFDLVIMIYLDFCVLKPNERSKLLENIYTSLKRGGCFIFDVMNSKNIEEKVIDQSWEVTEKGFWSDAPYIALNNGYHYPENKAILNQHVIVDKEDNVRSYLFWSTYYEAEDLASIIKNVGFEKLEKYENVLPGSDIWNGENVDFYVARK